MASTTPKRGLPYPNNADAPNIAGDFAGLATAVDTKLGSAGKSVIPMEEARTNTAYGLLATPDRVSGIVLPTDGLIVVALQAMWKESVAADADAAIFIGGNQLKTVRTGSAAPAGSSSAWVGAAPSVANRYHALASAAGGLKSLDVGAAYTGDVTTGQLVGVGDFGGPVYVFAAAGTYDVSVQYKALLGTVTVKNRKLWVWTQPF